MNWLSGINVLAGIWLIISPWVLGFSSRTSATWDAVILGIIVGVLAAIRFFSGHNVPHQAAYHS